MSIDWYMTDPSWWWSSSYTEGTFWWHSSRMKTELDQRPSFSQPNPTQPNPTQLCSCVCAMTRDRSEHSLPSYFRPFLAIFQNPTFAPSYWHFKAHLCHSDTQCNKSKRYLPFTTDLPIYDLIISSHRSFLFFTVWSSHMYGFWLRNGK